MIKTNNCNYKVADDLDLYMHSEKMDIDVLSKDIGLARHTIYEVLKEHKVSKEVIEKIYNYLYSHEYRLNSAKEEFLRENGNLILFHGSKFGLDDISIDGSRENCDFGKGFYLGETFNQALSFVAENEKSYVYSFSFDIDDLKIINFKNDIEWILAICYFRGNLTKYQNNKIIKNIINKVENADIIIAPIADNRMFYIMSLFIKGDINVDIALHSLSASSLGKQYVIKSKKALSKLNLIEKHYICKSEREESLNNINKRKIEIDTKLKMSKRLYKDSLYIEEILK